MPESQSKGLLMSTYVDSDHAGILVTCRSRTGFLIYLNLSLIYWH